MTESTRHRRAFDRYWQLGAERSLERLHAELERAGRAPSLRTLYEWSRRYGWQARIAELEREARQAGDQARIAAVREMQERQAREGLLLQQKGAEWLSTLGADEVSAEAAIRAVVEGARLERLARGEVTERTGNVDERDPQLERLTDDELQGLIRIATSAVEGAQPQGSE